MASYSSDSGSDCVSWVDWFLRARGNEFFCEVDEEYLSDRFNLTGITTEVHHFQHALELVTDSLELDLDDEVRDVIEVSARHLYGLIHARYIITPRGLAKMLEKYKAGDFGVCPRVLCQSQHLLPIGLSDISNVKPVQLYCPHCEDVYSPKSARHADIDGAYFGASFPHILLMGNPHFAPQKNTARYVPKIFGFRVHSIAEIHRAQGDLEEGSR